MSKNTVKYEVQVDVDNTRTGKGHKPGDVITRAVAVKTYTAAVVDNWVEIGVLKEVANGSDT